MDCEAAESPIDVLDAIWHEVRWKCENNVLFFFLAVVARERNKLLVILLPLSGRHFCCYLKNKSSIGYSDVGRRCGGSLDDGVLVVKVGSWEKKGKGMGELRGGREGDQLAIG